MNRRKQPNGESVEPYARIADWALVRLHEPGRPATTHVVGHIVRHGRLIDDAGAPYIGSALKEIDVARRMARNGRGKLIVLVGDPLPPGPLPDDLAAMIRQAEDEWQVANGTTLERAELATLAELTESSEAPENGGAA